MPNNDSRPQDDPTKTIATPATAMRVAEHLLDPTCGDDATAFWRMEAAAPLAAVLYASSPAGNGLGISRPVLAYFCTSGDGSDPVMLDTLNIKTMQSDPLIEPEHKHGSATSSSSAHHVKRLAASVLERAGVTAARIEKTA
jgi:hypothetical protein